MRILPLTSTSKFASSSIHQTSQQSYCTVAEGSVVRACSVIDATVSSQWHCRSLGLFYRHAASSRPLPFWLLEAMLRACRNETDESGER